MIIQKYHPSKKMTFLMKAHERFDQKPNLHLEKSITM